MKKVLISILTITIIILINIIIIVSQNNSYIQKIENNIKNHLNQDITYISYYNYTYVVKTSDTYIALNDKYDIINTIEITNIPSYEGTLIYKNNKFMYEIKKQENNKITYTYYDVYNQKEIKSINLKEV